MEKAGSDLAGESFSSQLTGNIPFESSFQEDREQDTPFTPEPVSQEEMLRKILGQEGEEGVLNEDQEVEEIFLKELEQELREHLKREK